MCFIFASEGKNKGNVKKVVVCISLTIEKIGFIFLTKHIIKLKVNVFCRVNLVFNYGYFIQKQGIENIFRRQGSLCSTR